MKAQDFVLGFFYAPLVCQFFTSFHAFMTNELTNRVKKKAKFSMA